MKNVTEGWSRCGPNEITNLARRLRMRRQRRAIGGAALLVGAASLLVGMWFFPPRIRGPILPGFLASR